MEIPKNQNQDAINANALISALDNTGVRMFMYFPKTKIITVPEKTCAAYQCKSIYENMPYSFAEDFVHEEDYEIFHELYFKIDRGEKTATAIFHSKDLNFCNHVTLTTVGWLEDGSPEEVIGIIEDMSDTYKSNKLIQKLQNTMSTNSKNDDEIQEAVNLIANSISDAYLTIYHIWLEDFSFVSFQDETTNYMEKIGERIPINKMYAQYYIKDCVEPKYQDVLNDFFDFGTLAVRLHKENHIECVYRRKKIGWTKAQYIAAKRDDEGNVTNVIFTIRDINTEVEQEEKKKKALFELHHDPMTGAYNRKAFNEMTKKLIRDEKPMVFAMLDIDEFKMLNDTYGHDVGDQVLCKVVECFFDVLRSKDWIFRLGGDEFAIVFNNCTLDIWDSFCRKQEFLHRKLHESFPQTKNITMSIGMCYSENGYREDMFKLADEALYNTKNSGRSGCTLIDRDHKIQKQWRDENSTLQTETALDRSTTGVYRIEIPDNIEEKPRMFCNETAKMILGVEPTATPERCHEAWIAGIDPTYYDALEKTRKAMLEEGQAECTYLWNHPNWGKIYVRSGGFGVRENGIQIFQGYHHALKNTKIIEKQDDSKLLFNALSNVYFASYYLDLEKQTYATFKGAPGEDNIQMQDKSIEEIFEKFVNVLVNPLDRPKMKAFVELETLQQRIGNDKFIDCEYRSQKLLSWCRARFLPIKFDEKGKLTHVLFAIATIDAAKAKELDASYYNRRSLGASSHTAPGGVDDGMNSQMDKLLNVTDASLFERFRHESQHDPLTDLYNRKSVFEKCYELLETHPEDQFVMVHMDMKHFRLYNTFFGDQAGDKLLCDVADLLRMMDADYEYWAYGRIEADVFCAFFPYEEKKYMRHITMASEYLKGYRSDFLIEIKLGIYFVTDPTMSVEAMFTRATIASKEVMPGTPYATVIYDEKLEKELNEKQQVINEMQMAIDEEQFQVYLQPKYSLRTNKMVGAEALVRWIHPQKGIVSPGMFIPVFESNGFITILDRYMWEHVCKLLSKWKREGTPLVPISVNVSRLSMFGAETVEFLQELVKKYDIEPKYLELELTESAYIDNPEDMKGQMNALREAGFTILLDDFGSGYSSLNTLRELPVDVLKLDMKFLSLDSEDIRGGLVISSIVRMSKLLNLVIIAEGVEVQEQADFLKGIGCEYVQGYLFARPMPVDEFEKQLVCSKEPLSHVNKPMIVHIGRIIAETDSGTYAMGTAIPSALAFLEYAHHDFSFLRVNPAFYTEFDLDEDLKPAKNVFDKCLSKESKDILLQAMEKSIHSKEKIQVPLLWQEEDGKQRKYACQLVYEGNIGAAAMMVAVFTNITKEVEAFCQ